MKTITKYLFLLLISNIISQSIAYGQSDLQSGIKIPVYPGATLNTEAEEGESPVCCNFVSNESFEKVVEFYESSLKIKSLDVNGLEIQYPFLKPQTSMMKQQMPAGMKIRFFVLKVVEFQGQKGAEIFEVVSGNSGVEFSVMPSQFNATDSHFEADLNNLKSGNKSEEELMADLKIIIAALPSAGPAGFERRETETFTDPLQATVSFIRQITKGTGGEDGQDGKYQDIFITISDNLKNTEFVVEMIKVVSDKEKAVKVKGKYDGKESIDRNDFGCVQANKIFLVNKRFLVEIRAGGVCDLNLVNQVIEKMNLDSLPK